MEFGIGNAEFGMQKIKAKSKAHRAERKGKMEDRGWRQKKVAQGVKQREWGNIKCGIRNAACKKKG